MIAKDDVYPVLLCSDRHKRWEAKRRAQRKVKMAKTQSYASPKETSEGIQAHGFGPAREQKRPSECDEEARLRKKLPAAMGHVEPHR